MTNERRTVLHSWCRQSQWDAPTVIGGAGARFHTEDGRRIQVDAEAFGVVRARVVRVAALMKLVKDASARDVSFANRGNLIILAPPLVIAENELQDALAVLDDLLGALRF